MKRKFDKHIRYYSNLTRARNRVLKEAKKWHAKSPYGSSHNLNVAISSLIILEKQNPTMVIPI